MRHPNYIYRWLCLASFFSRPWFTRVWVIQEYFVSAQRHIQYKLGNWLQPDSDKIEFYWGKHRLSPRDLAKAISYAHWLPDMNLTGLNMKGREELVHPLERPVRRGFLCLTNTITRTQCIRPSTFLEVIPNQFVSDIFTRLSCGATDPRDRIYAHLGLRGYSQLDVRTLLSKDKQGQFGMIEKLDGSPAAIFSGLLVDYDASIEDVYSSLILFIIKITRSLNILSICYHRSPCVTRTWTLDLTAIAHFGEGLFQNTALLAMQFYFNRPRLFCASKDYPAHVWSADDLSTLLVEGFRFAKISKVFQFDWNEASKTDISTLLAIYFDLVMQELLIPPEGNPEREFRTIWETWMGGIDDKSISGRAEDWSSGVNSHGEPDLFNSELVNKLCRQDSRVIFTMGNGVVGKG